MFKKLQVKILFFLFVFLALLVATDYIVSKHYFEKEYTKAAKAELMVIGETLKIQMERVLGFDLQISDNMVFEYFCHEVVEKYEDVRYAMVVDDKGEILFHNRDYLVTNPELHYRGKSLDIPEVLEVINNKKDDIVIYNNESGEYYGFVISIHDKNDRYVGAIVLGLNTSTIKDKINVVTTYTSIIALCIFLISLLLLGASISVWITKPLITLEKATKKIVAEGTDHFEPVIIKSADEIGRLANSFNTMAFQLQKTTVSKDYMDNVIASMMDSLVVINPYFRIITVNSATLDLLDYKEEELMDKPINRFVLNRDNNPFDNEHLKNLVKEGQLRNIETMIVTKEGKIIPVLFSCSAIKNPDNSMKYFVCTIKDITEIKKAEKALRLQAEELARSNGQLEEFAYVASHDLQEPLRKVISFGNRLKDKYADNLDEHGMDYLNRITAATERMQTLIEGLLAYSRVTTTVKNNEEIDLKNIVLEVVLDLEVSIESKKGDVLVGELPVIEGEKTQMRQLFQNFIGNALKFTKEDVSPSIMIYSKEVIEDQKEEWHQNSSTYYDIYIEDNGIGIDSKYYDRIFGVFQRLHGRTQYEGTGVGLAICKRIIENHGGSVRIESEKEVGTTFIIRLPKKQSGIMGEA
ncbi:PAS domain S-box-containing protein [Natranaerovirga pectinivora]|uniref:histidine kinase n=1 Tax=Natranaerovirga pectinivora TaxID=682400 RepID=A0A4R3MP03_9FIRM|nr:ATP-binding protein [Natranaerovirga pectinivora]TCT13849.1 PAS domain S-box-containing protein [Natranaerovirga pectinivora]